jgi:hypothetical protein
MVVKSSEWEPPLESYQHTIRLKNGKVRTIWHTRALSDVRHIPITKDLSAKYLEALAKLRD